MPSSSPHLPPCRSALFLLTKLCNAPMLSCIAAKEAFFFMDVPSLVREVAKYTQQRLPQYIEELRELCAIDSDSYNKVGLDEMALVLAERLRGIGMHVDIIRRETWGNDMYGVVRGTGQGNV